MILRSRKNCTVSWIVWGVYHVLKSWLASFYSDPDVYTPRGAF